MPIDHLQLHGEAISTGAAERYVLSEMSEQERDNYEEHFFICVECADEVRSAARFVHNAKPALEATQSVRPEPAPSPADRVKPVSGFWSFFRPLPLGAAAAAAILVGTVGYQSLILVPNLRERLQEATALQPARSYFLSISRGEAPVIVVSDREPVVVLTLSTSFDRMFPFYRCEIQDAAGRTVSSRVVQAPAPGVELHLLVPTMDLPAGSYAMVVAGLDSESTPGGASPDTVRYPFTLERR